MSYSQARRRADARIALMGIDTLFYRQHMILHGHKNDKWPIPVWEVRYEVDVLSGFTAYVRISLLGEYVDSNTPDGPFLPTETGRPEIGNCLADSEGTNVRENNSMTCQKKR